MPKRRKIIDMNVSVHCKLKKHFEDIGMSVNKQQISNAITCVYSIFSDDSLTLECIIKQLYPGGIDEQKKEKKSK